MAIGQAGAVRAGRDWRAQITDRVLLLKPRVMSLVVFTGGVGLLCAPVKIDIAKALITLVTMACGAGACGALNMWYDNDIDALMQRTGGVPSPLAGCMQPKR
jgi:protoheme IX farnesyltransferase